jgi:hypothetical protein
VFLIQQAMLKNTGKNLRTRVIFLNTVHNQRYNLSFSCFHRGTYLQPQAMDSGSMMS